MKPLLIRSASAVIAVLILISLFYFFQINGLKSIIVLTVLVGIFELSKMLFPAEKKLKSSFIVGASGIFLVSLVPTDILNHGATIYAFLTVFMVFNIIAMNRQNASLLEIQSTIAKTIMGIFYIALLPSFTYKLLELNNGLSWFVALLVIVFMGDTMAYLVGVSIGKAKYLPYISPKKSVEGVFGGLLGSTLGAIASGLLLTDIAWGYSVIVGLVCGIIAQYGDFFESLLKRVANVKDSGKIMPGHGGVLDRIDGVLFAAPFIYLFAQVLS